MFSWYLPSTISQYLLDWPWPLPLLKISSRVIFLHQVFNRRFYEIYFLYRFIYFDLRWVFCVFTILMYQRYAWLHAVLMLLMFLILYDVILCYIVCPSTLFITWIRYYLRKHIVGKKMIKEYRIIIVLFLP